MIDWIHVCHEALLKVREKTDPLDERAYFLRYCAANMDSPAQLYQDLFVLFKLESKSSGYFVEFGAGDGISLSNTLLLEKRFGWTGILAEPARRWHQALANNRNCIIDTRCVWSETGKIVEFLEAEEAELSTIRGYETRDRHRIARERNTSYPVETVSLNDLLDFHDAPKDIDYVSVDTEGSEFDVLKAFDFGRHRIKIFTIEHNFVQPARDNIRRLMERNGFCQAFEAFSKWDDWYFNTDLA